MENFKVVIFILTILIGLSALLAKTRLPQPVLLVVTGLIIGFVPALPDLALDPAVVFLLFLPPILYDASSKTSWHEFKTLIRPISALAISLVFFTTLAVAVTAHYLIPGFSWPLAFLLGAIVSPPDAAAATSLTRGLGLSKNVIVILEGESLLNDASALIAYRYAIVAATTGTFILWQAGLQFLMVAGGGILSGLILGNIFVFAHRKISNNALVETSLTLVLPFVAYLIAEHFHFSGVLSVVSAGLIMSWRGPEIFSYHARMRTRVVWDTLIFILNGFIFILIGLQLPGIIKDLGNYPVLDLVVDGLYISLATIIVRIVWVFAGAYWQALFLKKKKTTDAAATTGEEPVEWKNVLIVAWTGTRGIISLAAALALPLTVEGGESFPKRHSIIFLAFVVIFVTLVVQGLSLPLLIRLLGIKPKASEYNEEKEIKLHVATSTLHFIEREFPVYLENKLMDSLKNHYTSLIRDLTKEMKTQKKLQGDEAAPSIPVVSPKLNAQKEISKFQRELLIKLHKDGTFSDSAIKQAELERDVDDLKLELLLPKEDPL